MLNKRGPYILLITLLLVLFFILGVRLGEKVEKTNKTINYLISLTPSVIPTLIPSPTQPSLKFTPYSNTFCGIKFLYPKNIEVTNAASASATFVNHKLNTITFNCLADTSLLKNLNDLNLASAESTFKNKRIIVKKINKGENTLIFFSLKNPKNGKVIYFEVEENFYPLLESTLEFIIK